MPAVVSLTMAAGDYFACKYLPAIHPAVDDRVVHAVGHGCGRQEFERTERGKVPSLLTQEVDAQVQGLDVLPVHDLRIVMCDEEVDMVW